MIFKHLEYFLAVCDYGSIQSASKALFVSAQGIGKAIQQLEDSLGITLFERTHTGVVPTDFGRTFYEQAKCVEREMGKLRDLANDYKRMKKTRIHIGTLGRQKFFYGVNNCVAEFRRENPDTILELDTRIFESAEELFVSVRSGEVDIGWMFHWREHSDLKYFYVNGYSPLLLLISADHPLSKKGSVNWEELAGLRFVTAGDNDPFSGLVKELSISHGFEPDIAIYTTENNLIANMVDCGAAVILLRECYYKAIMQFCHNAVILPLKPEIQIANSLFVSKRNPNYKDIRTFVDYMMDYFCNTLGMDIEYK